MIKNTRLDSGKWIYFKVLSQDTEITHQHKTPVDDANSFLGWFLKAWEK